MTRLPLCILLLAAACGPGQGDATGGGTTAASAATGSTGTASASGTTTHEPPTPTDSGEPPTSATASATAPPDTTGDASSTTAATSPTGATDFTTSGDTTNSDTTNSDTTGSVDVEFAAFFFAGGLDHIFVHAADFTHSRCTTLHLARPTQGDPALGVTAPDMWGLQSAEIRDGLDGCLEGMPVGDPHSAIAGAGAFLWPPDPMQLCPHLLDLDLTLEYPQDAPWVPAKDPLATADLIVQDCPP